MHKLNGILTALLGLLLTFGIGTCMASTATRSTQSTSQNAKTADKTSAKSTTNSKQNSSRKTVDHALATAEDLSGTISNVDLSNRKLTLIGSNGVPYDFHFTKKTQVELSNQKIGVKGLSAESQKQAIVHFVPMSNGNRAENIQINAS
jgi:hypothetical protein